MRLSNGNGRLQTKVQELDASHNLNSFSLARSPSAAPSYFRADVRAAHITCTSIM
jgi:hypothetical protein